MRLLFLLFLFLPLFSNGQIVPLLSGGNNLQFRSTSPTVKTDTLMWTITAKSISCHKMNPQDSTATIIMLAENYLQYSKEEINTGQTLLQIFETNIGPFYLLYRKSEGGFVEISHGKYTWVFLKQ